MLRRLSPTLLALAFTASLAAEEGYVPTPDGVRLYYEKSGSGEPTLILPSRLFLFPDFQVLAERFTVIAYDMRNRGRSDFVQDGALLTLEADVEDLETIRRHFGVERFSTIGYSYLGKMIVFYALRHPERVDRMVQIGAVPMALQTRYPEGLRNDDADRIVDPEALAELRRLREANFHLEQPEEYCEREWLATRARLAGNPANAAKLGEGACSMPNEWPTNLVRHLFHHFGSMSRFDLSPDAVKGVSQPVLTIHGKLDRNAPYGAGREWAFHLPNARLLTVEGAAHQVWVDSPAVIDIVRRFFEGPEPVWPEGAEEVDRPVL